MPKIESGSPTGSIDSDLNLPWNPPSLPPSGAQSVATAATSINDHSVTYAHPSPTRQTMCVDADLVQLHTSTISPVVGKRASAIPESRESHSSSGGNTGEASTMGEGEVPHDHPDKPSSQRARQSGDRTLTLASHAPPALPMSSSASAVSPPGSERSPVEPSRDARASSASLSGNVQVLLPTEGQPDYRARHCNLDGTHDYHPMRGESREQWQYRHPPRARTGTGNGNGNDHGQPQQGDDGGNLSSRSVSSPSRAGRYLSQSRPTHDAGDEDDEDDEDEERPGHDDNELGNTRKQLFERPTPSLDAQQLRRLGVRVVEHGSDFGRGHNMHRIAARPQAGSQLDRLLEPSKSVQDSRTFKCSAAASAASHLRSHRDSLASELSSVTASTEKSGGRNDFDRARLHAPSSGISLPPPVANADYNARRRKTATMPRPPPPKRRGSGRSEASIGSSATKAGKRDCSGNKEMSRAQIERHLRRWDEEREAQREWNRVRVQVVCSLGLGDEVDASIRRLFPLWERVGYSFKDRSVFLRGLHQTAEAAAERHGSRIGLRGGPASKAKQQLVATRGAGLSGRELLAASGPVRMKGVGEKGADAENTLLGLENAENRGQDDDDDDDDDDEDGEAKSSLAGVKLFPGREAHMKEVNAVAGRVAEAVKVACQGAVKAAVSVEVTRLEGILADPQCNEVMQLVARREAAKRRLIALQRMARDWQATGHAAPDDIGAGADTVALISSGGARSALPQLERLLGAGASSADDQVVATGRTHGLGSAGLGDVASDAPSVGTEVRRELVMPVRVQLPAQAVAQTRGALPRGGTGRTSTTRLGYLSAVNAPGSHLLVTAGNASNLSDQSGLRRARTALPGMLHSSHQLMRASSGERKRIQRGEKELLLLSPSRSFRQPRGTGGELQEMVTQAAAEALKLRRTAEEQQKEYDDMTRELLGLARRQELATGERFRYRGIRVVQSIVCERALAKHAETDEARARARRAL